MVVHHPICLIDQKNRARKSVLFACARSWGVIELLAGGFGKDLGFKGVDTYKMWVIDMLLIPPRSSMMRASTLTPFFRTSIFR